MTDADWEEFLEAMPEWEPIENDWEDCYVEEGDDEYE